MALKCLRNTLEADCLPTMNLTALRMFLLTAERGSLSEAARALDVTQSAVSKAIARLQEEHGVLLIETSTGRPCLTPAGQHLLPPVPVSLGHAAMTKRHRLGSVTA